jgi:2-hydroxychromene-2-carboxylate isomerase
MAAIKFYDDGAAAYSLSSKPGAAQARQLRRIAASRVKSFRNLLCKEHIFGAPTFVVGNELFWGNDRLEAALKWSRAAER